MNICKVLGNYYQLNRFGLYSELSKLDLKLYLRKYGISLDDIDNCTDQTLVRTIHRDSVFIGKNESGQPQIIKCSSEINSPVHHEVYNYIKLLSCTRGQTNNNITQLICETQHFNFPQVYGIIDTLQGECLILEFITNALTFEQMFGTSPENFPDIVRQSFSTLDFLHSKGIVHDDLGNGLNMLYQPSHNRVVMIDLESNADYTPEGVQQDNRSLALNLWIIFNGDISEEMYQEMFDEADDYSPLIELIQEERENYLNQPELVEAIDAILYRLI